MVSALSEGELQASTTLGVIQDYLKDLELKAKLWVLHCGLGAGIVHVSSLLPTLGKRTPRVKKKPVPAADQEGKSLNLTVSKVCGDSLRLLRDGPPLASD